MELNSKLLSGKTALVTGCSKGIGLSILKTFAKNGANVFANDINEKSLDEISASLSKEYGVKVISLYFDVSKSESVKSAFETIRKESERLDILVNNAGIMVDALLPMISPELLNSLFSINVYGSIYCMQYASRKMMSAKSGSIINISSIVGTEGNAGQVAYSGTKAAIIGITKSSAKELARYNIRVNAIAPGFIDTDMARSVPEKSFESSLASIKMGRIGTPEDIADCALYLASDLSKYVTGQIIGVNGGMTI